jgi:hypothetical protein
MSKLRFVGLDVHAETIAVAVAETDGEVRSVGNIPNRLESVRKMIGKLAPLGTLKCAFSAHLEARGSCPPSAISRSIRQKKSSRFLRYRLAANFGTADVNAYIAARHFRYGSGQLNCWKRQELRRALSGFTRERRGLRRGLIGPSEAR